MSYKVIAPVISEHDAEQFGKWLGKYQIAISGLAVYQVDVDGKRHGDNAMVKTIKQCASSASVAANPGTQAAASVLAPVLAPIAPFALPLMPLLIKINHSLNKRIPDAGGKEILHTEVEFDFAGVSAKRLAWSEYLFGCWCGNNRWTHVTGQRHAADFARGERYAANHHGYPPPWSEQSRRPAEKRPARAQPQPARRKQSLRERLEEWL